MEGTGWRPILEGELRVLADRAVGEIAESLAGPQGVPFASLASGLPGIALFFAYLGRARPGEGHEERAGELLETTIEALAVETLDASLYAGFTGVAWTAEHIGQMLDPDGDDRNEDIDEVLLDLLARSPWRGDYDLVSGLAGTAVYALERLERPSARACLELVLDRLEETAERQDGRATWKTRPELLLESTRLDYPDGYYNVGVAHGVPGLAVVLAAMAAAGTGGGRAGHLLAEATAWILDRKLGDIAGRSLFPFFVRPGSETRPGRFAWCYGDPGVAAALLAAAQLTGDGQLADQALAVARRAAAEPTSRDDVVDAGLCHGAAGVAHLFNRMHQAAGDDACAGAARRWFARALDMRRAGEGLAGFRPWSGPGQEEGSGAGLLLGVAGIGLALLAATSAIEPAWDRLLLASAVRARSAAPG